ncbi:hypothetical protein APASM_2228 [Actinosynnema pretiosum subsp. pretiosum]|nr:hypothetical protein APASM_2228 [Actinosynnema pretiosum subsp. pretiosum]
MGPGIRAGEGVLPRSAGPGPRPSGSPHRWRAQDRAAGAVADQVQPAP